MACDGKRKKVTAVLLPDTVGGKTIESYHYCHLSYGRREEGKQKSSLITSGDREGGGGGCFVLGWVVGGGGGGVCGLWFFLGYLLGRGQKKKNLYRWACVWASPKKRGKKGKVLHAFHHRMFKEKKDRPSLSERQEKRKKLPNDQDKLRVEGGKKKREKLSQVSFPRLRKGESRHACLLPGGRKEEREEVSDFFPTSNQKGGTSLRGKIPTLLITGRGREKEEV